MANHRMLRFARIENIVKDYIMEERENERAVTARAIKENILMKKLLKEYSAKIQFYTEQGMASYEKLKATHLDFMRLMEKINDSSSNEGTDATMREIEGSSAGRVVPLPGHSGNITPRDSKRPNTLEQGARNMADSGMGNLNPPPAKRRLARVSPMVQGVVLRQGRVRLNRLDVSNLDSGNRALIESISSQSSTPEDVNRNSEADQDSDDSQH